MQTKREEKIYRIRIDRNCFLSELWYDLASLELSGKQSIKLNIEAEEAIDQKLEEIKELQYIYFL